MPSVQESLCHDTTSITEALSVMIQKEQTVYTCTNYLLSSSSPSSTGMDYTTASSDDSSSSSSENDDVVTAKDRQLICDWCYSIVDATQFDRETVAMAMEIIDRFLSSSQSPTSPYLTNRKQYQLLSMSSLYIAIKAHEQVAMSSEHFATMSNGLYTQLQIEEMEMKILHTLQWKINAPTSVQFAYSILSLLYNKLNTTTSCEEGSGGGKKVKVDESTWCFILDETRYQIEYALRDYALSTNERFSTLALSSIFNALDTLPTTTTSNYNSHRRGAIFVPNKERDVILNALLQLLIVKYSNKFVSIEHVYNVKDRLMNFVTNSSSSSSSSSSNSAQTDVEDEPSSPIRNDRQVMEEPTTPTASDQGKADNSRSISRSSPRSSIDTCSSGRQ